MVMGMRPSPTLRQQPKTVVSTRDSEPLPAVVSVITASTHASSYAPSPIRWCSRRLFFDAPIGEDDLTDPEYKVVRASKEFVAVLDSQGIRNDLTCKYECTKVNAVINPVWDTEMVTIILWTGQPDAPWLPPCQTDIHSGRPRFARVTTGTYNDGSRRQCFAMDDLWADVGDKINSTEPSNWRTLRIVNATAILETYLDTTGERIKKSQPSTIGIEQVIRTHADMHMESESDRWTGEINFLSMEEWIALGEWEDVFTYKEMAPFLTKKAMLGSNE